MHKSGSLSTELNIQMMLAIVGLLYTGMTTSYAIPKVKLIPSDVAYFSNVGSLLLTCTVDQDVHISSVIFKREGQNYVGIFNPAIPNCSATKYFSNDSSVYYVNCDQERNFLLIKYGSNAENHRTKWTCIVNSFADGPCKGVNNPCLSEIVIAILQVPVTTVQLMTGSGQTLSSSVNIVRGQSTGIRCSTAPDGSRPRATFQWYIRQRNQSPVLIVDQSISPTPDPGTVPGQESDIVISYSTWTLTGNASYQDLYIYCEARDETNTGNYTKTDEVQLNIVYPPVVQIFQNQSTYTVTEGMQNFAFNCNIIEAKPLPQANGYSWFHGTVTIQGQTSSSYTIPSVQRSDAGEYSCTAWNDYGKGTSYPLDLNVQYGPTISTLGTLDVEEAGTLSVTCNVSANPPSSVIWTRYGKVISNSSVLVLPNITRLNNGDYICNASNVLYPTGQTPVTMTAMNTLVVSVLYGPGNSTTINPNVMVYEVEEGKTAQDIVCSAICKPECSYKWLRNNTQISNQGTLSLGHVHRNMTGRYVCEAYNTVKEAIRNSTVFIEVMVKYGAMIISLSVAGNNTVNENMTATINCLVDSNPESNITWTKHGLMGSLRTDVFVHKSQLTIEHARCFDTANYTCNASNGLGGSVERNVPLYVTCHPRTDFQSPPIKQVYGKHYGNASLRFTVISFPEPTFNWTFIGNGSENRRLPDSATHHNNGLESILKFTNLAISDFGFYNVTATNLFSPSATETFQLTQADLPEVPFSVTITDVKQTSLTVQWVAGYNGGTEQTFHILITAGDMTRSVYVPDPGYGKVGNYNIEELMPNTEYSIYMSANNSVGSSNATNAIFQITLKVPDTSTSTGMLISAVAGGISAGIVAVLLVGIGIIVWRRYQHSKNSLDGLVENPVYDSSDVRPSLVVEYAAVDKSTKKGSQKEDLSAVKGKKGKKSRGEIYENATFGGRSTDKENVYENPRKSQTEAPCETVYENPHLAASNGTLVNKGDLLYADLMLDPPTTKKGKPVIRGLENRTVYADIAYGMKGEPLPEIDEEEHGSSSNEKREK